MRNTVVVALAALAVACPGPEPARPAPEVSSVTAFCQAVVDVDVQKIVACTRASVADAAAVWGLETAGACDALAADVAAGKATYRPDDAASCLAALERAPCDTFEDGLEPAECARVLVGATEPGGACDADYQCAGGSCRPSRDPCTDVCVADLPAGASCRDTFASCGPGLGCDFAGSGTCVPTTPGQIGAACGLGSEPCVLEAYCDAGGSCRAKLPAGSSCLDAYDACAPGTLCDDEDAYPVTRAECVPWVGQGAACGPFVARCAPGFRCDATDRCARMARVGEACASTEECFVAWCDAETGTCAPLKALGDACTDDAQCGWEALCSGNATYPGVCTTNSSCTAAP